VPLGSRVALSSPTVTVAVIFGVPAANDITEKHIAISAHTAVRNIIFFMYLLLSVGYYSIIISKFVQKINGYMHQFEKIAKKKAFSK
jgi:hypothetical protein